MTMELPAASTNVANVFPSGDVAEVACTCTEPEGFSTRPDSGMKGKLTSVRVLSLTTRILDDASEDSTHTCVVKCDVMRTPDEMLTAIASGSAVFRVWRRIMNEVPSVPRYAPSFCTMFVINSVEPGTMSHLPLRRSAIETSVTTTVSLVGVDSKTAHSSLMAAAAPSSRDSLPIEDLSWKSDRPLP